MYKQKSFTLIELLVVIVIIGILAGVIMISTSSSIDKANFAKAQAFSSTVQNELLSNLVSEWTFDEGDTGYNRLATNIDVKDTWGSNNGTVYGDPQIKGGSDCVFGKCLEFDGNGDYIAMGNKESLNIIKTLTVSLWVKSTKNNSSFFQGIIGKANLSGPEYGWIISKRPDNKFYFQVNNGGYSRTDESTYSNQAYTDSNWHYVVSVLESNGSHYIYIDGEKQEAFKIAASWIPAASSIGLVMGTAYGDAPNNTTYLERFGGRVDDVRVYDYILTSSQIKQNYIAGLNSMLANGNISKEEYSKRIKNLAYEK
jgi:prepilin-type N-terminal cleavage/methylation domain-containing protein